MLNHISAIKLQIFSYDYSMEICVLLPKYRLPSRIDFQKGREEIAAALNDFGNRWCKREYVEPSAGRTGN